jgi:hypothetical protein
MHELVANDVVMQMMDKFSIIFSLAKLKSGDFTLIVIITCSVLFVGKCNQVLLEGVQ